MPASSCVQADDDAPADGDCTIKGDTACYFDDSTGRMECDFGAFGCTTDLDVKATNYTYINKVSVYGTCKEGTDTKDFCCMVDSQVMGTHERLKIIGTAGPDTIQLLDDDNGPLRILSAGLNKFEATVEGRGQNDTINGSTSTESLYSEKLSGESGTDVIKGYGGDDQIWGGANKDYLHGGDGNDRIWGGQGNDEVWGNDGDDVLYGGSHSDKIEGGEGKDEIWGGSHDDPLLDGGPGDDVIHGEGGNDVLLGGTGSDDLVGGWHNDYLYANDATGTVETDGNRLHAGPGEDTLTGSHGNDVLYGGVGADILYGVAGTNTLCENAMKTTTSSPLTASDPYQRIEGGSGSFDTMEYQNSNVALTVLGDKDIEFLHFETVPSAVNWWEWAEGGATPSQYASPNTQCTAIKDDFGAN